MTFFCVDWRLFAARSSTKLTPTKANKQMHKKRRFLSFLRRREFWVPALVGSWFRVCFSALSLSEHFISVQHAAGIRASFSPEAPVSIETQRKRQHAFDLLGEKKKRRSKKSTTSHFQNYLSIPLSPSSIQHPQPTLGPSGFKSLLFGHLPC